MGANAITSFPTYVAGEVLGAARLNATNCGVPVFATTATRDAAFGGTGEKVLAEGQMAYLEDSDVVQYYDGSTWIAVSRPGLVFLTGASFTTVTSFSLPTDTFTSTYKNYRIICSITAVTSDCDLTMRLRAAGSDTSTGVYETAMGGVAANGAGYGTSGTAQTSFLIGESDNTFVGYGFEFDVLSPKETVNTRLVGTLSSVTKTGVMFGRAGALLINNTTSYDSLSVISSVSSSITGTYRVYGYRDS